MTNEDSTPEEWDDKTWAEVITNVVSQTAMPDEDTNDIVVGGWLLGQKRASVLDRSFWPGEDVVYPLCLFCWWPFKPAMSGDSRAFLRNIRRDLFGGVSSSLKQQERLQGAIPDELLIMETQQLLNRLREEPASTIIRIRQPMG